MKNVLIIGAGGIGRRHIKGYLSTNRVTISIIEPDNEKIKGFLDHKNIIFSDFMLPSANEMGIISFSRFKKSEFEDISDFQPKYLKEFGGKKINI